MDTVSTKALGSDIEYPLQSNALSAKSVLGGRVALTLFTMLQTLKSNVQYWEVVAYPLQGILLVDVAAATLSPGEHGDSATDLPSKRLTVVNVLSPTNIVCGATLYSHFCGGICSSSLHAMAAKASSC